jgi:diaminohydroxyphosphoribosylaminopyrimidine deaminase / 5-amino-6-(5-phosphoribosylamino)uracil reductase
MNKIESYTAYLMQALAEAAKGRGHTAPNPAVGAVIVKAGRVIGRGYHAKAGSDHAEVAAIAACSESPQGATIYVSLEPCCHTGRTPPCTDAIIHAGFSEVVFAHADTNPDVAGKSSKILKRAGIAVQQYKIPEIEQFYQAYDYWRKEKKPFITAKLAVSRDLCIADMNGRPIQITGATCHRFTHEQRLKNDVVMTTVTTVLADNPKMNARLNNSVIAKPLYILDRALDFSLEAIINKTALCITVFCDKNADMRKRKALECAGVRCCDTPIVDGRLDWGAMLSCVADDGYHALWFEAGAVAFLSVWNSGFCQKAYLYQSDVLLGAQPVVLPNFGEPDNVKMMGDDRVFLYTV